MRRAILLLIICAAVVGNYSWAVIDYGIRMPTHYDHPEGAYGYSFSQNNPWIFWPSVLISYISMAALIFLSRSEDSSKTSRLLSRSKATLTLIFVPLYLFLPLTIDGSEWHGDAAALYAFPLMVLSMPTNIFLYAAGHVLFGKVDLIPYQESPIYADQFAYGWVSVDCLLMYLVLLFATYVQLKFIEWLVGVLYRSLVQGKVRGPEGS